MELLEMKSHPLFLSDSLKFAAIGNDRRGLDVKIAGTTQTKSSPWEPTLPGMEFANRIPKYHPELRGFKLLSLSWSY